MNLLINDNKMILDSVFANDAQIVRSRRAQCARAARPAAAVSSVAGSSDTSYQSNET